MKISVSALKKAIQYARQNKFDRHSQFYRPVVLAYAAALKEAETPISPTPQPEVESKTKMRIIKNKLRCKKCNDIIESKHRHDFQMCSCESVFVDGGTSYMRRGGDIENMEDLSEVEFFT